MGVLICDVKVPLLPHIRIHPWLFHRRRYRSHRWEKCGMAVGHWRHLAQGCVVYLMRQLRHWGSHLQ